MKTCAWCAEEIQDAALICRHCGRDQRTGSSGAAPASATGQTLGSLNPATTNVMAIISLVCGIASFVILPLVGHVAAVVLGYRARREIADSGGAQSGEGIATAGIVLGWLGIALFAVLFLSICGAAMSVR